MDEGWNQIQFNLSDFVKRAYGTNYVETLRIQVKNASSAFTSRKDDSFIHFFLQIHANCRIRRVYFADRLYSEDELPAEFKLYLPIRGQLSTQSPAFAMTSE